MRVSRRLARAAVATAVLAAAFWFWQRGPEHSARWVVTQVRDDQRTLLVEWPQIFGRCDERPSIEVDEVGTEIRMRARYRSARFRIECGQQVGVSHRGVVVRLDRPLAGRKIVGERQATVPVKWSQANRRLPIMPSVVGMDAAAVRRALSRAHVPEAKLPAENTPGFVTSQWPRPGTNLNPKRTSPLPAGKPPRLAFSP